MDFDKLIESLAALFQTEHTQADYALCGPADGT